LHDARVDRLRSIVLVLLADVVGSMRLAIRPRQAIAAENLVLRRQLARYEERGMKPEPLALTPPYREDTF